LASRGSEIAEARVRSYDARVFRVFELTNEGSRVVEGESLASPPGEGARRWIDLTRPDEADLRLLGDRFGFHPLALEDCAHRDQRPKAEEYGDHLFIVTQGFECPHADLSKLHWLELHAFVGTNYLVTVHDGAVLAVEQVWKRVTADPTPFRYGAAFVYYLLADELVDDNFPILDQIADDLEAIEDAVLTRPSTSDLGRIFALKHQLVTMRKVLSPQRDVMAMLSKRGDAHISERTALYFRDVYDHLARIVESIEANRDLLGNALDAYLSATSQRTNEIMKALAILSAVFMPLTFITGFFGQNFEGLPFSSRILMWGMLASLVASPLAMLLWFKSRKWF
jgi:magnesium transporter